MQERRGRETVDRADFFAMRALLAFVASACCAGVRVSGNAASPPFSSGSPCASGAAITALVLGVRRLGSAASGLDRVALARLATLALADPAQAPVFLRFMGGALASVAPWLLLSVGVAAYAAASGADHLIARAVHGRGAAMLATAALTGRSGRSAPAA